MKIPRSLAPALLASLLLLPLRPASAQEAAGPSWDLKLGLSYLSTSGNSETRSAGFDALYHRAWGPWGIEAAGNAINASQQGRATAESYLLKVRGKRTLSGPFELTAGLQGEKNRFAGLDLRSTLDLSLLWNAIATDRFKLHTLSGLAWVDEDFTGASPANGYLAALLGVGGEGKLGAVSGWTFEATYVPNFEDSDDYRLAGNLALQAALTDRLALRVGYDYKFDHQPAPGFKREDSATAASLVVLLGKKPEAK